MKNWVFAFAVVFTSSDVWAGGDPPDFVLAWGSNGTGDGQFGGAHGIEVDADGNVYVSDTGNNRIQKFTSDGVFLTKWGTFGTGPGQFTPTLHKTDRCTYPTQATFACRNSPSLRPPYRPCPGGARFS